MNIAGLTGAGGLSQAPALNTSGAGNTLSATANITTQSGTQVSLSAQGMQALQLDIQEMVPQSDWEQILKAAILLKALENDKSESDDSLSRMLIAAAALKALDQATASSSGIGVATVAGTSLTVTVS